MENSDKIINKQPIQVNTEKLNTNQITKPKTNWLNVGNSIANKPRIDIVLQATGRHGWSSSHGWVNVLQREGWLNRVFTPIAAFGSEVPINDDGLFEYLKNPQADIMLMLGFDFHSQPLYQTLEWQERWHQAPIKKIAILQECYSAEIIQNTPTWKYHQRRAIVNIIPCVDALICHHEPDIDFLQEELGLCLPMKFLPFGIDRQYFQNNQPFAKRLNRALFRGSAPRFFTEKCYEDRQKLINLLNECQYVDLFPTNLNGDKQYPLQIMQDYVKELNSYRILLNLPSISQTLTARPFEILACGGLLLQNRIIGEESNTLFQDWENIVYYDADNPQDLIEKIEYLISEPELSQTIANKGQMICHDLHTIECRIKTILEWADNDLSHSNESRIASPNLPINFFTIVLNGQPFIRYHIDIFKQLPFKWHWHIVEGVADLKHDTAWGLRNGGYISEELHKNGRSCDGTTEYLDELAELYPDNVTIYRQPEGVFWDGKKEMVNAPLVNIQEECLLWQVDVDELWTLEQICTAREIFINHPDKTAAFYWCWYFVGEKLIISTRNCYAQNPQQEWLRTWRFKPGAFWAAHEPPVLVESLPDGQYQNIANINPFLHQETENVGLVFQHFAYVTPEQLQFKEQYYGYKNAIFQWQNLQNVSKFPVRLQEYFAWVQDETLVDIAENYKIIPIAQKELNSNNWRFLEPDEVQQEIAQIQKITPMILVDGVFFQLYQTGIARVWQSLLEEWANNGFSKHIIVLDRAGTAPKIPGIKYLNIPAFDYNNTVADREMLQQLCDQENADLFISSYYTTPTTTPSVFMAYDMIPEVMGWDMKNPMWQTKHHGIQHASAYIAISENTVRDLVACFDNIPSESVTVAYCGVSSTFSPAKPEEIHAFKYKYGITKPYFLLVGAGSGYKNSILFFQAFSKLASSYGFDIVFTGSGGVLSPEFRVYTLGSAVHMVQLSDEELAIAYSGAVALVYPSKYEGFGMPVLEAMACGCPVITCPNASIPEVAGEAAIYVRDNDVDNMENALCDVQKPAVRNSLITAGLAQAKKFSWTKMAQIVSSALIDATLLSLNLREINLIVFPDWSQSEELISLDLEQVIKAVASYSDSHKTTLLINTENISPEDAELFLSSVTMSLLMQEDLDISEELEISFVGNLADIQWETLLSRISAKIALEYEDDNPLIAGKLEAIRYDELESFKQARDGQFFFQLGNKHYSEEKWQETIEQYQSFLGIHPGDAVIYWRLSQCYGNLNLLDESFKILQQGIKLFPTDGNLHFTLITNLRRNGRIQEAIASAEYACQCLPDDYTFQILKYLTVPAIYNNQDEIEFYRQRYIQGLKSLIEQTSLKTLQERNSALAGIGRLTNFYLSYQAQNDLDLQRQYGKLVHEIMAANFPQWVVPLSMPKLQANQKIRVGYVSHYLHSYSGTLWLTGWLRYCNHQNFEIYCYYIGNEPDPVTQQFQNYSDVFHHIPYNLTAVCEQILADKLHILVFPEIGMNPQTMQMAALRLAPVQCTAWGHPVTTGLSTIDYFLSSELMEPENAQVHYSETLIRLPNIGVSYPKPYIPPVSKTRADFQLPDDAIIYLCCQAPFKYLPQYDFIFAEIARRIPQSKFLFLRGTLLQQRLKLAFEKIGLNSEDYCIFLSIPERLDYLMINLLADVYLDTFTWSGGNTSLEAIACNLPIVTCPGEFMRGRHSDSFLKMLGITDTIAKNEAEYIEIAVTLGLDTAWRHSIKKRMSQSHDLLFDDKVCVTGLEAFYKQVVETSS